MAGAAPAGGANEELEEVQAEMWAHPQVLKLRYNVYAAAKQWNMALEIASFLHQQLPDESFGGNQAAIALHKLGRTQEAKALALGLVTRFPKQWDLPYNLACYCAQLGELKEAEHWFKAARALNEDGAKRAGIEDPDLVPLWEGMWDTTWKKSG
ncbi:MAG: tetratricopeptide repeat protein [Verrucomicrobia bacterium]|nr:tetratricopeptide repeat protein [Verrucomicrobiota bacterium]NBU10793.1 tetratricopeptide repeat protein [Pseudomonadota bacterium]NDA65712.1 tetratricopeptide repeat protein [Verrucomicrobiota bacterium]NDB74412.1 tetratricopeptide repeat protein [Verrucomicrobiota bacterium]NDD37569.1 tetratricopeptide repeat protein [Verrucomicrobiota bacterium]